MLDFLTIKEIYFSKYLREHVIPTIFEPKNTNPTLQFKESVDPLLFLSVYFQ